MKSWVDFVPQLFSHLLVHGDVIDDPVEKIQYYINHRIKRERQILEAIVASQKSLTTMKILYQTTSRHLGQQQQSMSTNTWLNLKNKWEGDEMEGD